MILLNWCVCIEITYYILISCYCLEKNEDMLDLHKFMGKIGPREL